MLNNSVQQIAIANPSQAPFCKPRFFLLPQHFPNSLVTTIPCSLPEALKFFCSFINVSLLFYFIDTFSDFAGVSAISGGNPERFSFISVF